MASTAARPWHWMIETLAELNQVDTSLLKALVIRSPSPLSDAPGSVKERLALRYLEECLGSRAGDGPPPDAPSASGSGGRIDVGLPTEEVLCRHFKEVETAGNLEKNAESLKHDLRQFIMQKKATLPRPSLELLKESILEGPHQHAVSLKEHRGVVRSDQIDSRSKGHVRVKRLKLSTDNDRIQLLKQTSAQLSPNQGCNLVLPHSPGSGQHLQQRDISGGNMENQTNKGIVGMSDDHDIHLLKQSSYPQPPTMQNSHVQHASTGVSQKDVIPPLCLKSNPSGEMHVRPETNDGDGDHDASPNIDPRISTKKHWLLSSSIPANYDSMTEDWTEQGLCIKCDKDGQLLNCSRSGCFIAVHESCLGSVPNFEETGLFYCPFCSYTRAFNDFRKAKRTFCQAKKDLSTFIGRDGTCGSQKNLLPARVSGEESHAELFREKNHDPNVHRNQCEKSSETAEAPQEQAEYVRVSDTNKLPRGNTDSQNTGEINKGKGITDVQRHQQTDRDNVLYKDKCDGAGSNLIPGSFDAEHINRPHESVGDHQEQAEPHATTDVLQSDVHNMLSEDEVPCDGAGSSPGPLDANINRPNECVGVAENQEQAAEPHATHDDDCLPCNKDDTSQIKEACNVNKGKGQIELLNKGKSQIQEQEKTAMDHETINPADHDVPSLRTSRKHAKRKQQVVATEKTQKTEGNVEDQNRDKSFSGKHSKRHVRPKQYSDPIAPHGRRTKLFWTSEEEETLKIAVQKFAENGGDGSYPWTKILEFGRHVFHNTRQPCDLKDKWRNIKIKEGLKSR